MPVHHVANGGMVVAYEPLPEDRFIVGDPRHAGRCPRTAHDTDPSVRRGAGLRTEVRAPFMAHPITLLPITAKEYVERDQEESLTRLWNRLTPLARANAVAAYEGRFQ